MIDIERLPPAPLHVVEVWSDPSAIIEHARALGTAMPAMGRSGTVLGTLLLRMEPTVWLAEGDVSALVPLLAQDGAMTAIGGGVVRFRISGPGWRRLLLADGLFDAEDPAFAPGCCAATVIAHVPVRLWVEREDAVRVYVQASLADALEAQWLANLPLLMA